MATTPTSLLIGGLIGDTATVLYTSPVGTETLITKFTLTNPTGSAITVSVNLSSGTSTNSTSLLQTVTVPAGNVVTVSTAAQHILPPGASVLAQASVAASVIAKLSGVQFS